MRSSAVLTKVKDVGEQVGPRARDLRDAVGPKVTELREVIGPKAKDLGETIGPKVKVARRKVGFWIAGEEPKKASKWPAVAALGAGALLAYVFDPVSGQRRRAAAKDWITARFQRITGRAPEQIAGEDRALRLEEAFAPTP